MEPVLVLAALPSRREALALDLREAGIPTRVVAELPDDPSTYAAVVIDTAGESGLAALVAAASPRGPVLLVGPERALPRIAEVAQAADFAVDPGPEELRLRVRRLARRRDRRGDHLPEQGRRPKVLVVEDDPDLRELLSHLLGDAHDVVTAPDGETGVRLAFEQLPDAVLMDLFLPGMDGFAALRAIKDEPRTADVPVLFLSSQRDDVTRGRGLDLGADDFLAKPFSATELKARIDRALRSARQRQHLRTLAQTDALTGLANFRAFGARLEEEIERSRRYGDPLAALMIDLDELKPINDQLGHAAGNRALVELANAIRAELRVTDFAARYGGDEFVVLLPHTSEADARALAERLRRSLARVDLGRRGLTLRASFGVASQPGGADTSAEALIGAADGALYRAKRAGRDRVCVAGQLDGDEPAHA